MDILLIQPETIVQKKTYKLSVETEKKQYSSENKTSISLR